MNEMLLYAGFMNGVTSLFVPNLCSEQDNKVNPQKQILICECAIIGYEDRFFLKITLCQK